MEYTVCLINHNTTNRISIACEYWNSLEYKPKEIIIIDDGSSDWNTMMTLPGNVIVQRFKHTGNVSHMKNMAAELSKTDWFIIPEVSSFPYKGTMKFLIENSTPNRMISGLCVSSKDFAFPMVRVPSITIKTNSIWLLDTFLYYKPNFPYCNEIYNGWGAEDNDMLFRYLNGGGQLYFSTDVKFMHWDHERTGDFYDEDKTERNRQLFNKLLEKYGKERIFKIKKNKEGKRIMEP